MRLYGFGYSVDTKNSKAEEVYSLLEALFRKEEEMDESFYIVDATPNPSRIATIKKELENIKARYSTAVRRIYGFTISDGTLWKKP